jgi:hypothetical protein
LEKSCPVLVIANVTTVQMSTGPGGWPKPSHGPGPPVRRKKMLERLGLVLLAFVLVFAFAPYFYALAER